MSYRKKMCCCVLAFLVLCSMIISSGSPVLAAAVPGTEPEYLMDWSKKSDKVHIGVRDFTYPYIGVDLQTQGYQVKNIKSSSKNCTAKVVRRVVTNKQELNADGTIKSDDVKAVYDCISFYAKQKGTYKVSFDIKDKKGNVVKSKTITVYANEDKPFSSIKVNNITLKTLKTLKKVKSICVDDKYAKIKINMAKGYKITNIECEESKGMESNSYSLKNGKSIALKDGYDYQITITYNDKYTNRAVQEHFWIAVW